MERIIETVLEIGLEKPVKILHVTDVHLTDSLPEDDPEQQEHMVKRTEVFRKEANYPPKAPAEYFEESFALAHYAYTRIASVRGEVHLLGAGLNGETETLLDLTAEDICFVYLFHRYTKQTLTVLETLKKQGVPVVLVTAAPYDQVEAFATILLPCFVDAEGIKNTAVAPICLADYLCNAMAVAGGEAAAMRMQQLEKLYKEQDVLGY